MRKLISKVCLFITSIVAIFIGFVPSIDAQTTSGQVIKIGTLDNLLWSVVTTIQWYTLPVMAIALTFVGIRLVISSDETHTKSELKGWLIKILIGGFIVFGASTLANILKSTLS